MEFIDKLNEAINMLNESAGAHGLRRRIEIEEGKTIDRSCDKQIKELEKLKEKTRSKHKLAEIDKRVSDLNFVKNVDARYIKSSENALKNKGKESKKMIDRLGKDVAISYYKNKTNDDEGVAEARIRDYIRRRSQNESAELAVLLTEAALLLND